MYDANVLEERQSCNNNRKTDANNDEAAYNLSSSNEDCNVLTDSTAISNIRSNAIFSSQLPAVAIAFATALRTRLDIETCSDSVFLDG